MFEKLGQTRGWYTTSHPITAVVRTLCGGTFDTGLLSYCAVNQKRKPCGSYMVKIDRLNSLPVMCLPCSSPRLPNTRVAILYGSQTGNAQSIAEGVHEGCKGKGLESILLACDGWKKVQCSRWACMQAIQGTWQTKNDTFK